MSLHVNGNISDILPFDLSLSLSLSLSLTWY